MSKAHSTHPGMAWLTQVEGNIQAGATHPAIAALLVSSPGWHAGATPGGLGFLAEAPEQNRKSESELVLSM